MKTATIVDAHVAAREPLRDRTLAIFFTLGYSFQAWGQAGFAERECVLFNELSKHFKHIYLFTYGGEEDLQFSAYLNDNVTIVPRTRFSPKLYSFVLPLMHRDILRDVDFLRTYQMLGSWTAVATKLLFRQKLLVRTGYVLRLRRCFDRPLGECKAEKIIEIVSYRAADGIMTSSHAGYRYVEDHYHPRGPHAVVPNFVFTDVFKPIATHKKEHSLCCVAHLKPVKNLMELFKALQGLRYHLTMVGIGTLENELRHFAAHHDVNVTFLGMLPHHELPRVLNEHEIFILPSLWEGNPKALLEAMACGLPAIGTNVATINEIIEHGETGILCNANAESIRHAIISLMENEELKQALGTRARAAILNNNGFDKVIGQELEFYKAFL